MSNKTQLQENNATLAYVLEQLQGKPSTEDCMALIAQLQSQATDLEQDKADKDLSNVAANTWTNLGFLKAEKGSYDGKAGGTITGDVSKTITCANIEPVIMIISTVGKNQTIITTINDDYAKVLLGTANPSVSTRSSFSGKSVTITNIYTSSAKAAYGNASGETYKWLAIGY